MNGDCREGILKNINAALKSRKLYPAGHPATIAPIAKTYELLMDDLKSRNNLSIALVNEALLYEEDFVQGAESLYTDLIQHMGGKNIDAIIFEKGLSQKEVGSLFEIMAGADIKGAELQKEMYNRGVKHITLKSMPIGKRNILEIYNGAVEVVKNVMGEVRMGKIPRSEPVESIVGEMTDSVLSDPNAMIGLTMIKNYDNYLYNHSVNVSILSLSLARFMGLSDQEIHDAGVGALLHDIGKTGVSEQIIRKPGGLSSEEWEKVKEHPLLGSKIIKRMDGMNEAVGRIIYEHHIKYDHSGYPQTTSSLHPLSQIICICDAYDALTTLRVYQKPHDPSEAVKILTNFSGKHFNPETLGAFVRMMGVYPVGTMVRLASNEVGVVTRLNQDAPERPVVKVLYGSDGLEADSPYELDLLSNGSLDIVTNVNPSFTSTDLESFFEGEASEQG